MIDKITTEVRELVPFPQSSDYSTWVEYSSAMATALAQMNPYSIDTRALIVALNNMIEQVNNNTTDVESAVQAVKDEATKAINSIQNTQETTQQLINEANTIKEAIEQIVAVLPEGTINDNITSNLHTWSSEKIENEIETKTSELINDTTASASTTYSSQKIDEDIAQVSQKAEQSLGVGQSWSAYSMTPNQNYTNTADRAIALTGYASDSLNITVNGVSLYNIWGRGSAWVAFFAVIPPGATYKISSNPIIMNILR